MPLVALGTHSFWRTIHCRLNLFMYKVIIMMADNMMMFYIMVQRTIQMISVRAGKERIVCRQDK